MATPPKKKTTSKTTTESHKMTVNESVEWYSKNRSLYQELSSKVHIIIKELLDLNGVDIHAVFDRAKEIESFAEKIKDPKYDNPREQITDLAGIRVVCYVESDIKRICKIVEDNFEKDDANSGDKSMLLGTDKVGYKSVHYVCKLKNDRTHLPEYKNYLNFKFEIQVRTILQHAWAEIEHDRNYKFSGELPTEIQRRFKLVAGVLELADKEFDRIAADIDKVIDEVEQGTKEGELDFDINTTTLKQFLTTKFAELIPDVMEPTFVSTEGELEILEELREFGINKLYELNNIISPHFINDAKKYEKHSNFLGILRAIMIIHDWKKYFEFSYRVSHWVAFADDSEPLLEKNNVPLEEIRDKYNIA